MFAALKTREYRLLWIGQGISHLGDQFHLIALPWLVLTLTHDPLQLGLVLALAGIPRAAVMLIGGAFADRHSPRLIMLVSDALRFVIAGALAVSILTGSVQLWMVYALAVGFGVVSGFFMPAAEASLPRLLENKQLEAGNALMMGADQLDELRRAGARRRRHRAVRREPRRRRQGRQPDRRRRGVRGGRALVRRLRGHARADALAAGAGGRRGRPSARRRRRRPALHVVAPGLPLDARPDRRGEPAAHRAAHGRRSRCWRRHGSAQGAAAFGLLMAAFGLGSLAGMVAAGTLARPSSRAFSALIVVLFVGFGLVIAPSPSSPRRGSAGPARRAGYRRRLRGGDADDHGPACDSAGDARQGHEPVDARHAGGTPVSTAVAGAVIGLGADVLFAGCGAGVLLVTAVAAAGDRAGRSTRSRPPAKTDSWRRPHEPPAGAASAHGHRERDLLTVHLGRERQRVAGRAGVHSVDERGARPVLGLERAHLHGVVGLSLAEGLGRWRRRSR